MLFVRKISISGYRSIRSVTTELENLNVFVGRNGAGKTNLYRALQLVQAAALGTFAREIAGEGGMDSALWAGRRVKGQPARIILTAELSPAAESRTYYTYTIEAGAPGPVHAAFPLEPQVKEEAISFFDGKRAHKILQRRGPLISATDATGRVRDFSRNLLASETALASFDEPGDFPDHNLIRKTLCAWRFYHDLRTDNASPLRKPALAITATMLDADGGNLAAVFSTLAHIREDTRDLDEFVDAAFPGAQLDIPPPGREATFAMTYPDFVLDGGSRRRFEAHELSDGTLRFLGLAGALLAYHRPPFVALNEPESSLHPELMKPLAIMIARAAEQSQVWVVTHSSELATAIANVAGVLAREVAKEKGETRVDVR